MSVTSGNHTCHFQYLNCVKYHCDGKHPAVVQVEIWDRPCGFEIVKVRKCDDAHSKARRGLYTGYYVEQFHTEARQQWHTRYKSITENKHKYAKFKFVTCFIVT